MNGSSAPVRVRFAPSPTGYLHVGNARTALFNWLVARRHGGTFVLRLEDTDAERSTDASVAGILEDLRWLGLDWDEGPEVGGDCGPYRQSARGDLYREQVTRLLERGQAYRCFCSADRLAADREAALAAGLPVRYAGRCRQLDPADAAARVAAGEAAAVRFRVPPGRTVTVDDLVRGRVSFDTVVIGDPIILRADGSAAYNLAVVVDDALMRITHVIRGEDHISNTPRQLLLWEALGFPPPRFAHVSLVLGSDQAPLSKRHGATSVRDFRQRGYLPEALVNYLALLGWSPGGDEEIVAREQMVQRFTVEDVGSRASVFDEDKLAWVNRHYLKAADPARIGRLAVPWLARAGFVRELDAATRPPAAAYLTDVVPVASHAVDRLAEIPDRLRAVFEYRPADVLGQPDVVAECTAPGVRAVLDALSDELATRERMRDREAFREVAAQVKRRTGAKGRALFHPIRLALTAAEQGPELDGLVPAIERGAELPEDAGLAPILGCRERARQFVEAVDRVASPSR